MFGMAAAVLYSVNIFSFNTQNYELLKFAVSTLFGFSIASLIYFSAYRPVVGFCGIELVKLQRPLNLLEGETVYVTNANSLINIAKNKKNSILYYEFSPSMAFFYTIIDSKKYVFIKNTKKVNTETKISKYV